ncbi:hypothetical protein [Algicella marina]|uniref:Uncharacterized protein n=1 Tax=Algicella marina TaxID=2683284 RepID=A0A6P1SZJ1_9RHOB|nr:hypothetical protein [Algicella marina]QHQ34449.1 hypothetical protein GO499_04245 [Algicella marina]
MTKLIKRSHAIFLVAWVLMFVQSLALHAQEVTISYRGELAEILDSAAQAYVENFPEHLDWIESGQITIVNCGRNTPIEISDLPSGFSWTYEGYDETQSLAWVLDEYALMIASFSRSEVPYRLAQDAFSRLETRFGRYQTILFDGVEYNSYGEALSANLPTLFAQYGVRYPGLYYESGCGGPVEIFFSTEPPGAQVWRTTPLRAKFCEFREQDSRRCQAWNEVTGQGSLLEQGNFILYAKWPDGREVQSYRDLRNMPDPATVVLRPN